MVLLSKSLRNFYSKQGRNQDFAKRGGLKMEIFCDVILMT